MATIRPARVKDATAMAHVIVDTFLLAHQGQIPAVALAKRKAEWTHDMSAKSWRRYIQELSDGQEPLDCVYVAEVDVSEVDVAEAAYPRLLKSADAPLKVVGVVSAHATKDERLPNAAEVGSLYILEDHQGVGIGRELMQTVAAHMLALGKTALIVGVLTANTPARCFYEALGGTIIGEREFDEEGFLLPEVIYGWPDISVLSKNIRNTQYAK